MKNFNENLHESMVATKGVREGVAAGIRASNGLLSGFPGASEL